MDNLFEETKDVYIQDVHEQYSVIASEVITIFHHFLTFLHIFITVAIYNVVLWIIIYYRIMYRKIFS